MNQFHLFIDYSRIVLYLFIYIYVHIIKIINIIQHVLNVPKIKTTPGHSLRKKKKKE